MHLKRYETKSGKLMRKVLALGQYDNRDKRYERYATFDYMLHKDRVAVCLGFCAYGSSDLMMNYEIYASEVFTILLNSGLCLNFHDIDFHIFYYGSFGMEIEIKPVIFEDDKVVAWHGKNILFHV